MATGDLTVTAYGPYNTGATLKTGIDGQNCGAAKNSEETATFQVVYCGKGQYMVFKLARAA